MILEITQFKLSHNSTEERFLEQAAEVHKGFLSKEDGFVKRSLCKSEQDLWVDLIWWKTMDQAKAAATALVKEDCAKGFLNAIDPASVNMEHVELVKEW